MIGGREYSQQASPVTERNPESKYEKLPKVGKINLWPRYTNRRKSQDFGGPGVWENKGLGDLGLIAPSSLQEIHLTVVILEERQFSSFVPLFTARIEHNL